MARFAWAAASSCRYGRRAGIRRVTCTDFNQSPSGAALGALFITKKKEETVVDVTMVICLLVLGGVVGFAAGLLGIGGGMLLVPTTPGIWRLGLGFLFCSMFQPE